MGANNGWFWGALNIRRIIMGALKTPKIPTTYHLGFKGQGCTGKEMQCPQWFDRSERLTSGEQGTNEWILIVALYEL